MNNSLRIAIGVDHRGFKLKEYLLSLSKINTTNIIWTDVGTYTSERTDYPIYTKKVVNLILEKKVDLGILACGSGIGMAIAANRFKDIYAGLVWNADIAKSAKEDDNVNVLVLPADFVTLDLAKDIISNWLGAKFKGDRYAERIAMIDAK